MLVSCLMPTRNRHALLPAAVANFLAQDFCDAELLIVSEDGIPDSIQAALATGRVRHVPCPPGLSLGAKRNFACTQAKGELLAHWDDDDWYAPDRLRRQVEALLVSPAAAMCGTNRVYFRELDGPGAWEYRYRGERPAWLCGASLMFRRSFWLTHPFPDKSVGEDNDFVWSAHPTQVLDLDDPALCIASKHAGNTSRKNTSNPWWTPVPRAPVDALADGRGRVSNDRPRAALVLAGGIGDVLRWASLVPVLDAAGYAVDLLLAADTPDCAGLFAGATGVARILPIDLRRACWLPANEPPPALAVFSYWGLAHRERVPAVRQMQADRARWPQGGDPACIAAIAAQLGWSAPLPIPPLAPGLRAGARHPGRLAIHAGCKAGWPWKKWHGFGDLAALFPDVVRVGTVGDDDATGTYFARTIVWPAHVVDATTPRSLAETARLISQCAALVANDSGLMHLAAALGVPTLGIFGLTSPAREAMPWPALHALSGELPCETACRREPWGRRDCREHLACLKGLAPERVAARLRALVPALGQRTAAVASRPVRPTASPAPPETSTTVLPSLPMQIWLGGGFGDLLISGRVIEALWPLCGFGPVLCYSERPELVGQALGQRGLPVESRPWRDWQRAAGLRLEITQFVRFFDPPERWRQSHPGLAEVIARAAPRLASVRGIVDRHPHLDGLWARLNLAAGRQRGDALAWSAGLAGEAPGAWHEAPLTLGLQAVDAGPLLEMSAAGAPWLTIHDGFDTSARLAPGQAVKCWPMAHWQALVQAIKARHPALRIVQIGGRTSRPIAGVDACLVGRIGFGQALWLLKGARLHIDGESGMVHAARALGTPAVVLFGPTDAEFFGYAANCNLDAGACVPCWWSTPDWMGRCPRGLEQPVCMAAITPERVLAAVGERLAQRPAPRESWQLLESRAWSPAATPCRPLVDSIRRFAELIDAPDGHARSATTGCHLHATKQWEYAMALEALGGNGEPSEQPLRIADLGCGRAPLGPWLARQGHEVVGYDTDFAWDGDLEAARRFLNWIRGSRFQARPANLYALPEPDAAFDVVLLIAVLQHLEQPALALHEAWRLLRPGGRLIASFDLACEPGRFEDPTLRRNIANPARLAAWLGLDETAIGLNDLSIGDSASALQADGVAGMPDGLTVAFLCLTKLATPTRTFAAIAAGGDEALA